MATTLTLLETYKISRRVNGDVSFIQARVVVDGIPTYAEFRARLGEEPIIVDGDTITVADALVAAIVERRARSEADAARAADRAAAAASAQQADLDALLARIDAQVVEASGSQQARDEMRAHFLGNPAVALLRPQSVHEITDEKRAFDRITNEIVARHGLAR